MRKSLSVVKRVAPAALAVAAIHMSFFERILAPPLALRQARSTST